LLEIVKCENKKDLEEAASNKTFFITSSASYATCQTAASAGTLT
jgi:hypothetical protein